MADNNSRVMLIITRILHFDTFGGTQTLPFRVGIIQVPLSINPEQTPTFKSGTVEWVDLYFCIFILICKLFSAAKYLAI